MSATRVEARHAGYPVLVGITEAKWEGDTSVIAVTTGGIITHLHADEARRFAIALIEQAAESEKPGEAEWP